MADHLPHYFEPPWPIRALRRCGFVACGAGRGFAEARGEEIDELVARLGDQCRSK